MAFNYVNGEFVWVGPGPQPTLGETKVAYQARVAAPQPVSPFPVVPVAPGAPVTPPQGEPQDAYPWIWPLLAFALGFILPDGNGNGGGNGPGPITTPQIYQNGPGQKGEAHADWGGVGKHGREGVIAPGRTTTGTGWIDAETFRAWDPILQRYYQLENGSEYSDISFAPGKMAPDGNMIVKSWVTHAWRKDNSLASTQMARLANGRMMSLSETGVIKSWRPVKNIVMARGKTTLSQAVTAQRYLDKLWRKVARKTKQLKLA